MKSKDEMFSDIEQKMKEQGFTITLSDRTRPWGGFLVIDEQQAQQFADVYFDSLDVNSLRIAGKLSPKILIVAPEKRLSWQYHNRRAEIWRVIDGQVGVVVSSTDIEETLETKKEGDIISLMQGERHRLVGLVDWGVIAEIWQHTDPEKPSDEGDIIRVQDDFGR